jgi:hypothetical protein
MQVALAGEPLSRHMQHSHRRLAMHLPEGATLQAGAGSQHSS